MCCYLLLLSHRWRIACTAQPRVAHRLLARDATIIDGSEEAGDQILRLAGQMGRIVDGRVGDLVEEDVLRVRLKGRPANEQLVHDAPNRPVIDRSVIRMRRKVPLS